MKQRELHQLMLARIEQRREHLLAILREQPGPMGSSDLRREYQRRHGQLSDPIRDLRALEAEGKVERYGSEFGHGYVWLPL